MNCNTYFDKKIEIKEAICLMETKINELVEMYNRIDADHAIIAEKVKELEKLIDYLLGAGLEAEVKKKLEEWLADGTFADIIGETLSNLNNKIEAVRVKAELNAKEIKKEKEVSYKLGRSKQNFAWFGNRAINFIGDSITQGANCKNIPNEAYAELIKQSLQNRFGTKSRGIQPIYQITANDIKNFHEIQNQGFTITGIDNSVITLSSASSSTIGNKLFIKPIESSNFRIIFQGRSAQFKVYTENKPNTALTIDTKAIDGPLFTEVLPCDLGDRIVIENTGGATVKILGVDYIDTENPIMLNNYGRSGATLKDINSTVIDLHSQCEMAFFALGHNDSAAYGNTPTAEFISNINRYTNNFKANKTYVVVLDFIWHYDENNEFRKLLKKMAEDVDGIYIPFREILFPTLGDSSASTPWINSGFLSDWSHPTAEGHRIIADVIGQYLNLPTVVNTKTSKVAFIVGEPKTAITNTLVKDGSRVYGSIYIDVKSGAGKLNASVNRIGVPPKYQKTFFGTEFWKNGSTLVATKSGITINTNGTVDAYLIGDTASTGTTTDSFTVYVDYEV